MRNVNAKIKIVMGKFEQSPIETRREVDRSIEQTEAYKGAETLTQLGVLSKMKDVDLFHGRAGDGRGDWQVRADFNNSGNETGHHNINKIPALNTGSITTARDFAEARARRQGASVAEVHRIKSSNPDARIINPNFDWRSLSKFQRDDAVRAIRKTLPDVLDGISVDFKDRNSGLGRVFSPSDFSSGGEYGSFTVSDDIQRISAKLNIRQEMAGKISGARNARILLGNYPECMSNIVYAFSDGKDSISLNFVSGRKRIPIDREYVGNWLKNMDVVGANIPVHSATLGRDVNNCLLFELDDINTEERLEQNREAMQRRMGKMALRIYEKLHRPQDGAEANTEMSEDERQKECDRLNRELDNYFCAEITRAGQKIGLDIENGMDTHEWTDPAQLRRLLNAIKAGRGEKVETATSNKKGEVVNLLSENLYASPQDIIESAKKTPDYKRLFEAQSGVWEGFTIQQHTETALQFFDDNYADKLPSGVLPLLRLAIITHDIGKGVAASRGDKANQKAYNVAYADDFLKKNGIDEDMRKLIVSMIGDGMDESTDWAIRGGSDAKFYDYCKRTVGDFLGTTPARDDVRGFAQLELALQTCDSASYTDMAVTRSRTSNSSYFNYRNSPSFDGSFIKKASLNNRRAMLKRHIE